MREKGSGIGKQRLGSFRVECEWLSHCRAAEKRRTTLECYTEKPKCVSSLFAQSDRIRKVASPDVLLHPSATCTTSQRAVLYA